jgi:hypothetical protein
MSFECEREGETDFVCSIDSTVPSEEITYIAALPFVKWVYDSDLYLFI